MIGRRVPRRECLASVQTISIRTDKRMNYVALEDDCLHRNKIKSDNNGNESMLA